MQTSITTQPTATAGRDFAADAPAEPVWSLVYHSRASRPMSDDDLDELQRTAAARNRAEGLTGLLIYDNGRFFQWIEGPEAGLERVWTSIQRDRRHGEVDLLGRHPSPMRCFGDWDMKLSTRSLRSRQPGDDVELPPSLLDSLQRRPHAASELLASMAIRAPVLIAREPLGAAALARQLADRPGHDVLRSVVETVLIPQLAALHLDHGTVPAIDPRVSELARLLLAADPQAGLDRLAEFQAASRSLSSLCGSLYEPLARSLGDLWQADDCSELEMTIALCRVQTAMRRASADTVRPPTLLDLPAVLVAPQPGEQHRLGASLDAELLWQAGWQTQLEAPDTDAALERLVADTWFDALDLSLSASLRREHWLPRMAETIRNVREASRNPQMVVVVGGRLFHEQESMGRSIGADAGNPSAPQLAARIMASLKRGTA